MKKIPQMEPWFDHCEAEALSAYMKQGGWVTEFRETREFERHIAEFTGARYCSVVSNGTVSLTLSLMACGIGLGDEVIVPDFTMVATANAVKLAGAEVVFADISPEDLCLDFERMRNAVTRKTRAVMLVPINGRCPGNLEQFVDFCKEKGIWLIEDAAQSLGSFKNGRHLGRFGHIGSFSFSAPKIITTGQGGAIITEDETLIDRIRKLRDFGRDRGGADHYLTIGWNFKFTDIQAVIGLEQMKKLPSRVQRKKEIYALYRDNLDGTPGISFVQTNLEDTTPWFIDILVENGKREELIEFLNAKGIGARVFYPALHATPVYGRNGNYPVAARISQQGLWLPSSARLTDDEVQFVCESIRTFFASSC